MTNLKKKAKEKNNSPCQSMHHSVELSNKAPPLYCANALALDIGKYNLEGYDGKKHYVFDTKKLYEVLRLNPKKVFLESTGVYHRPITRILLRKKIPVYEINTYRFKKYREQITPDFKTDKSDVTAMYEYSKIFKHKQITRIGHPLEPLLKRFRIISKSTSKWKNILESCTIDKDTYNTIFLKNAIKLFNKERKKVETILEQKINPTLKKKYGLILTSTLLSLDPIRFPTSKHWCSYLGLKLKTYESGTIKKKQKITKKGFGNVRKLLYLQTMNFIKNKTEPIHSYHKRLKKKGKKGLIIMVACMRKIARQFWAEYKNHTPQKNSI